MRNGITWLAKDPRNPNDVRGFENDLVPDDRNNAAQGAMMLDPNGRTAIQKVANLERCLGNIANFAPIIYGNIITDRSTSMTFVWQEIKRHYGFQTTGGNFIDLVNIKYSPPERPETLYQRMLTFIGSNLMTPESGILHKGRVVNEAEIMTPTIENLVVLLWLMQIHPNLPNVVKQKYGADLRLQSLASLKPKISLALESLIVEAKSNDNARVHRTGHQQQQRQQANYRPNYNNPRTRMPSNRFGRSNDRQRTPRPKVCPLCSAAKRSDVSHFLSACTFLPRADKEFMTRARQIVIEEEETEGEYYDDYEDYQENQEPLEARCGRVNVRASPEFNTFYHHNPLTITVDTGAETNLLRGSVARDINCPIEPSTQVAFQADGTTPLEVVGETHVVLTRDDLSFEFSGLVVNDLDVDILAGVPFMEDNDISVRPKKRLIMVGDNLKIPYSSSTPSYTATHKATILRATSRSTVWPGEFLEVTINAVPDSEVAIEPHVSSEHNSWPEVGVYKAVGTTLRIPNSTMSPVTINKNAHLGMMSNVDTPDPSTDPMTSSISRTSAPACPSQLHGLFHSDSVQLNPDKVLSDA